MSGPFPLNIVHSKCTKVLKMSNITRQKLETLLNREVEQSHFLIARNLVLGGQKSDLVEILGLTAVEIDGILELQEYKEVFLLVSADYNSKQVDNVFTLDEIETEAWKKVREALKSETDLETLARVATMANKAVRRVNHASKVLNPASSDEIIKIHLTPRVLEHLKTGTIATEAQRGFVIEQSQRPSFKQIEQLMGGITPLPSEGKKYLQNENQTEKSMEDRLREELEAALK